MSKETQAPDQLDAAALEELEKKYDSALNTRDNGTSLGTFLYWATVAFAFYHIWTAGSEHLWTMFTWAFIWPGSICLSSQPSR